MKINLLSDVPENKKLCLGNGKKVSSIPELYCVLSSLPDKVFDQHVNSKKNDFYNWIKNTYNDGKLAEDLLECSTKEATLFCLKSRIEQLESLKILNDLPRGNVLEKVKNNYGKKPLITLLNPSVFKKKEIKGVNLKAKTVKNTSIGLNMDNEKFNKSQIKKIIPEKASEIIKRLKEVYEIE